MQETVLENVVYEMAAILFRGRWVNDLSFRNILHKTVDFRHQCRKRVHVIRAPFLRTSSYGLRKVAIPLKQSCYPAVIDLRWSFEMAHPSRSMVVQKVNTLKQDKMTAILQTAFSNSFSCM